MMRFMRLLPFCRLRRSRTTAPRFCYAASGSKRLQIDIAKLHTFVVTLKPDVSLLVRFENARMLLAVFLDILVEVGINQRLAVVDDGNLASLGDDLHLV